MSKDSENHVQTPYTSNLSRRKVMYTASSVAASGALAGCSQEGQSDTDLGEPVETMKILSTHAGFDPEREEVARWFAENTLQELGIDTEFSFMDLSEFVDVGFGDRDFDVMAIRWAPSMDRLDPDVYLNNMLGDPDHSYNMGGFYDEDYSEVATEQRRTLDDDERIDHIHRAQELLHDLKPSLHIINHRLFQMIRTDTINNWSQGVGFGYAHLFVDLEVEPGTRDRLYEGHTDEVGTFNPVAAIQNQDFREINRVYDKLVRVDKEGEISEWLATDWERDGLTITMTIRDGHQWHDGEPVTIEDVKFSFDYQAEHDHPFLGSQLEKLESVEITGENEISFTLNEEYGPIYYNLFAMLYIIPEHIWKDIDNPIEQSNDEPIGSGPWIQTSWSRGERVDYDSFDEHFNSANISGLTRIRYSDSSGMAQAVTDKEIDRIGYTIPSRLADEYRDQQEEVEVRGIEHHGFYELRFNVDREPLFQDERARQALAHATNLQQIKQIIFNDVGELIADHIMFPERFDHSDLEHYEYNMKKAKNLLEEAGFGWDSDGNLHYPSE